MATNKGYFRRGHDPRRHLLTQEERIRGGVTRGMQYIRLMHLAVHGYDPWPLYGPLPRPLVDAALAGVRPARG